MVKYFGSQLSLLVSSSRVERIVKDEAIGTLVRGQNNKEMMAEETDYDLSRMIPVSSGKGTGDGLRLGWSVGGRKDG
ncbi:hypothetical protein LOB55_10905, partial [Lactobacillus delbrueckii subsp. lactis]|uniref:hypothetical protein n=1 Tax=Lactobacillus delbrueckii TaxID=1584 RepID=UPI001E463452